MKSNELDVLIAEDDAPMREMSAELLAERGHRVVTCASGEALLKRLGSAFLGGGRVPDVLVTDDRMPGARGSDVLAGLHDGRWPIPAVLVTAFPDCDLEARARAVGARLLGKPFDAEQLVEAVEDAASRRPPR